MLYALPIRAIETLVYPLAPGASYTGVGMSGEPLRSHNVL